MTCRSMIAVLAFVLAPALKASAAAAESLEGSAQEGASLLSGAAPLLEPSTLVLVGLGLIGLAVFRTRYRQEHD
ncbi:MAG: PEP-CTERM sorting domain-containing protein [Planctomycetes bacterium]|nr:PEP-CTERM sorting domain-containing protein [Planctomycetota bacterium]